MVKLKLAALCSGGKDGSYALWKAAKEDNKIANIVTMLPEAEDSWMFHKPNPKIIDLFGAASNIPLKKKRTTGIKEKELEDLKEILEGLSIDGVVSGAVASSYQKQRISRICDELGLVSITPIWHIEPFRLLEGMLEEGFKIMITSVSAQGLDKRWLGRKINSDTIEQLRTLHEKLGIHPTGEGGEYETLTLDAPFFKRKITPTETEKKWKGDRGHLEIKKAELSKK